MSHYCNGSFSVKSATDGERVVAKRIKIYADGLKVKTWLVAAAVLVSEKDSAIAKKQRLAKRQVHPSH